MLSADGWDHRSGEQSTVGAPGIATSVAAIADLVEIVDEPHVGELSRILQGRPQMIAFCIDVSIDMVRDLARRMTESYAFVVCR